MVTLGDGTSVREKTVRHGTGQRYRVRYIDPDGRERSRSFPDRAKRAAEDFLTEVESDKRRGSYIDPAAGRMTFGEYAKRWLQTHAIDESTREGVESRLRNHLLPPLGERQLASIRPETIREWDRALARKYAVGTRAVSFAVLRAILSAAVDDGRIAKNPCSAKSVTPPRQESRKVVPWSLEAVNGVRSHLLIRYRAIVDVGAGCGARQGEIFGLAVDDMDLDGGWLHIRRQVKRVRSRLVFGLPKNDKERRVPLPDSVANALIEHMRVAPPITVSLPWEDPASDRLVSACLVFTSLRKWAINKNAFDPKHWHRALRRTGLAVARDNGMHALRHFYASSLLDGGESIRALSEYLGHSNPAFTLRVYTHLMPGREDRARSVIDGLLSDRSAPTAQRRPSSGQAG